MRFGGYQHFKRVALPGPRRGQEKRQGGMELGTPKCPRPILSLELVGGGCPADAILGLGVRVTEVKDGHRAMLVTRYQVVVVHIEGQPLVGVERSVKSSHGIVGLPDVVLQDG